MKRYYLSPIVGTGADGDEFRPKLAPLITEAGAGYKTVIPTSPVTGKPTSTWCLVLISAVDHTPFLAASGVDALPDFPLDARLKALRVVERAKLTTTLQAKGLNTVFDDDAQGFRDVVNQVGQALDQTFDSNKFDA